MWVPNSKKGPKMPSLEGENEIPHIPKLDFLAKTRFLHSKFAGGDRGKNGYNSLTRPPIQILRPLFTLQLLILPTRDPFQGQKS